VNVVIRSSAEAGSEPTQDDLSRRRFLLQYEQVLWWAGIRIRLSVVDLRLQATATCRLKSATATCGLKAPSATCGMQAAATTRRLETATATGWLEPACLTTQADRRD